MTHISGIVFGNKDNLKDLLDKYDVTKNVDPYIEVPKEEIINSVKIRVNAIINDIEFCRENLEQIPFLKYRLQSNLEFLERFHNFETPDEYERYSQCLYTFDDKGNAISDINPNGKWVNWEIGGNYNGCLLHAGSYDTNQASLEVITKVELPECFVDLDGNWHDCLVEDRMGDYDIDKNEQWHNKFSSYLMQLPDNTVLTVIDFQV